MLDLNDFRYFVAVVDSGSFSATGRVLDKPTSTVSYRIHQLETELGLTLLARTSRRMTLTEAGKEFYPHALSTLQRATEAELAMRGRTAEPSGLVRYTVSWTIAHFAMSGIIVDFMRRYPKVELFQHCSDEHLDIIAEQFDLAIRTHHGPLPDSTFIQRPLASLPWHLFASPGYLEANGRPNRPQDLDDRATLFIRRGRGVPCWHLFREDGTGEVVPIALKPRMSGACLITLKGAAEAGEGVVALPAFMCRDEILSGRLARVLSDWRGEDSTVSALMPSRHGLTAAGRAFLDHIADHFPSAVRLS